jgi:hypothetical protein
MAKRTSQGLPYWMPMASPMRAATEDPALALVAAVRRMKEAQRIGTFELEAMLRRHVSRTEEVRGGPG